MSENEEVPVGKPKRKIWKIVVPVIILAILIPSLMYAYAYSALGDAYYKSWETLDVSELGIFDPEKLNSTEFTDDYTIHNPTGTSIRFVKVNFDGWADDKIVARIRETDKYLPAGGSTTITCTWCFDSEVMNIILSPSYEDKTRREIVVSTTLLFITVTRTFIYENTETKYNVY